MKSANMQFSAFLSVVLFSVSLSIVEARPGIGPLAYHHGVEEVHHFPLPGTASRQTTVVRDLLGNQGTAYAYQHSNGISSSAVAVSRSDNSKTLAFVPAIPAAPSLIHSHPAYYGHHDHHHHHHYNPALVAGPGAVYSNYVGVV